jgi:hypothetical protein
MIVLSHHLIVIIVIGIRLSHAVVRRSGDARLPEPLQRE